MVCDRNAAAFEETVGDAISICIETDDLIAVVDRGSRCGTYAVWIVDVSGESFRCDIVSIAVRRPCRVDVEAYGDIVIIHPEQVSFLGFRMVRRLNVPSGATAYSSASIRV